MFELFKSVCIVNMYAVNIDTVNMDLLLMLFWKENEIKVWV